MSITGKRNIRLLKIKQFYITKLINISLKFRFNCGKIAKDFHAFSDIN